jgi:hypothetical protein
MNIDQIINNLREKNINVCISTDDVFKFTLRHGTNNAIIYTGKSSHSLEDAMADAIAHLINNQRDVIPFPGLSQL